MRPQHQTVMVPKDADGKVGDCFCTCVAMLLDMDRADVPNFLEKGDGWALALNAWLHPKGLAYIEIVENDGWPFAALETRYPLWGIAVGPSRRGDWNHAVVATLWSRAGDLPVCNMKHDPNPIGDFIPRVTSFGFFVVLQPSQVIAHSVAHAEVT